MTSTKPSPRSTHQAMSTNLARVGCPASRAELCGHPCNSNCPRRGRRRVRPSENRYRCTRGKSCGPADVDQPPTVTPGNKVAQGRRRSSRDGRTARRLAPQAQLHRVPRMPGRCGSGEPGESVSSRSLPANRTAHGGLPRWCGPAGYWVVGVAVSSAGFGCGVKLNPSGSGTCRT